MPSLLLDTCAIIWIGQGAKVRQSALEAVAESSIDDRVFVSPFSAWELSLLSARNRLGLGMGVDDWFGAFQKRTGVTLAPLPVSVLVAAHQLPGTPPNDPADRILIATARQFGHAIVTRDRRILDYGDTGLVQTVVC
ncbi:MAG: type II toxin-antitoxin system VapC family toxin [Hyphomonadaceae bacterium]|nr:type II toxin-antitoxin system VapC family toxin [Hyphomonadaceae bacterium]